MTGSALETVLRRDRWIVGGAIGIIVALAWGYVLWLANDMDMGGMDMTGFRMIPAGIGTMLPALSQGRIRTCITPGSTSGSPHRGRSCRNYPSACHDR